jgi:hypothetical protein
LGHIYEYTVRDQTHLNTQIAKLHRNRESRYVSDEEYHNHRTEKIANVTSVVLYRINEAISDNITDANEMYSYVLNNTQRDIAEITSLRALNHKSWRDIKIRLARIIYEITSGSSGTDIKQIIMNTMQGNQ